MDRVYKISTNYDALVKGEKVIGYILVRDKMIIGFDEYSIYAGHLSDNVKKYMLEVRCGKKMSYIKYIFNTQIVKKGRIITNEILADSFGKSVITLINPREQYELLSEIIFKVKYFICNNEIVLNDIPSDILRMVGLR